MKLSTGLQIFIATLGAFNLYAENRTPDAFDSWGLNSVVLPQFNEPMTAETHSFTTSGDAGPPHLRQVRFSDLPIMREYQTLSTRSFSVTGFELSIGCSRSDPSLYAIVRRPNPRAASALQASFEAAYIGAFYKAALNISEEGVQRQIYFQFVTPGRLNHEQEKRSVFVVTPQASIWYVGRSGDWSGTIMRIGDGEIAKDFIRKLLNSFETDLFFGDVLNQQYGEGFDSHIYFYSRGFDERTDGPSTSRTQMLEQFKSICPRLGFTNALLR